jgi:hypothetical protein
MVAVEIQSMIVTDCHACRFAAVCGFYPRTIEVGRAEVFRCYRLHLGFLSCAHFAGTRREDHMRGHLSTRFMKKSEVFFGVVI